jgi:pimeloyl-ACP methyl ester carboxylesterase
LDDFAAAHYDEFGFLESYARHEGLPWTGPPAVARRTVTVAGGQRVSGLVWGTAPPELALIHGIGQNAHTWDSVAMALGRPLVALDLPGHGHSDWRDDADYRPATSAVAVAAALAQLAPAPRLVVGMSLGGLTTIALAARYPELVPRVVIVDVTPGVGRQVRAMTTAQRGAVALLSGPPTYDSFELMLAAAAATQPGRPAESLRPGVLHNARQLDDGRWGWRYDLRRPMPPPGTGTDIHGERGSTAPGPAADSGSDSSAAGGGGNGGGSGAGGSGGGGQERLRPDVPALWDDLESLTVPIMLVRGGNSSYVHDEDQAEFARRQPGARIELVEGSGHSVQSDRATYLAGLIADFLATS